MYFTTRELRFVRKHLLNARRVMRASIKFKLQIKSCTRACNLAQVHLLTARWCVQVIVREHQVQLRVKSCTRACCPYSRACCPYSQASADCSMKGVNAREYILTSIKFKSSGTVAIFTASIYKQSFWRMHPNIWWLIMVFCEFTLSKLTWLLNTIKHVNGDEIGVTS